MRFLLPVVLVLSTGVAVAASPIEKAVKARQGYFQMLSANMGPISAMVKGERDYDEAAAAMHGANLEALAQYGLAMHFPKGSSTDELGEGTTAKPEIWSDLDGFVAKYADFSKAAAGASADVKGGKGNAGAVLKRIGRTCKSCHDDYRLKR